MIRVGILGAGTVVSFQAPGIARIPDVEIAGFYDPGRERAEKMAAKFGGRVYETDDALIGDDSLDAVLNAAYAMLANNDEIVPPFEDKEGRIPVTEAHKRNIVDPMSALREE